MANDDRAQMSTQSINDLPDSDFAYIEPGGTKDSSGKTTPRSAKKFGIDMQHNSARAALLRGSRERRMRHSTSGDCEIRMGSNGLLHFEGVFCRFDDPYEVTDRFGTFTETADPKVLARTLNANPDTVLNINHDGLPLARTTSGYLTLSTTERAGIAVADMEPRDPDVQRIQYKVERGDMPDMSWAFRCIQDVWNDDQTERRLMEASIDGGDVSIVTTGANRNTGGSFRSALTSLVDFDKVLVEARAAEDFDLAELREAHASLGRLISELTPRTGMSVKAAELELLLSR